MVPIGVRGCLNLFPKTHYRRLDKDSHGLYSLTTEKQIILVVLVLLNKEYLKEICDYHKGKVHRKKRKKKKQTNVCFR